jgi:hypothetical protein
MRMLRLWAVSWIVDFLVSFRAGDTRVLSRLPLFYIPRTTVPLEFKFAVVKTRHVRVNKLSLVQQSCRGYVLAEFRSSSGNPWRKKKQSTNETAFKANVNSGPPPNKVTPAPRPGVSTFSYRIDDRISCTFLWVSQLGNIVFIHLLPN